MPKVPSGGASRRRVRALSLLVGILLTACDVGPFVVDHDQAVGRTERTNAPVETVTAVEVEADDLMLDMPSDESSVERVAP